METKKAQKKIEENSTMESVKEYRVIYCGLKDKKDAIQNVINAKTKGYLPMIIIEKGKYKLLYAKGIKKVEANQLMKGIKESGLEAEICEY